MELRGDVDNFPAQLNGTQPGGMTYTKWYSENTQKRVEIIIQLIFTQTWILAICVCDVVKWSEVNEAEPRFQRPPQVRAPGLFSAGVRPMALASVGKLTPTLVMAIVGVLLMATSPHSLSCNHRFGLFPLSVSIESSIAAV